MTPSPSVNKVISLFLLLLVGEVWEMEALVDELLYTPRRSRIVKALPKNEPNVLKLFEDAIPKTA